MGKFKHTVHSAKINKSIAIINAWGTNRGDEAMQRALIYSLHRIFPEIKIHVFVNSQIDLPDTVSLHKWGDLPVYHLASWVAAKKLSVRTFYRLIRGSSQRITERRHIINVLKSCNVIVSGPAGPYIGELYPETEPFCLSSIKLADFYQKPCVIAATSAGPFAKPLKNAMRRAALNKVLWWTLRDPISFDAARSLALANIELELCGDLVFSYDTVSEDHCESLYERAETSVLFQFLQQPTIGVTVNTTSYIDNAGVKHHINRTEYVISFANFLQAVVRYTNSQLLFFPHHYGTSDEMRLIREIVNLLPANTQVRILSPYLSSDCQQMITSRLTMYISHRYHPTIFALHQTRPVFCITHQFKTVGLLKLFDYPVAMPNTLTPVDMWFPAFKDVWDDRDIITRHIQQKLPEIQARARRTIERLVHTLS
jgi:polysaccharide pyruvyl transferase WcaK-like protein